LVLMHFGTYLQDYFTRAELDWVLPVVYAGGRVGGIAGGWLLARFSPALGPLNLVPVFLGLYLVCLLLVTALSWRTRPVHAPEDERGDAGVATPEGAKGWRGGRGRRWAGSCASPGRRGCCSGPPCRRCCSWWCAGC